MTTKTWGPWTAEDEAADAVTVELRLPVPRSGQAFAHRSPDALHDPPARSAQPAPPAPPVAGTRLPAVRPAPAGPARVRGWRRVLAWWPGRRA